MIVDLATARQLHLEKRYADAARSYHTLIQHDPRDAGALHLFGMLHHQNGYHAKAIELIGRAIALRTGPEAALYHANLAEVHRCLGQFEQAAECCRTALRLAPDCAEAANNLGLALHDLGRHDEAVEQYRDALRMRPDNALAQNNLGTSVRALGKTEEAIQA
jgi:tetratricopeptide (TPR) repeat protein